MKRQVTTAIINQDCLFVSTKYQGWVVGTYSLLQIHLPDIDHLLKGQGVPLNEDKDRYGNMFPSVLDVTKNGPAEHDSVCRANAPLPMKCRSLFVAVECSDIPR